MTDLFNSTRLALGIVRCHASRRESSTHSRLLVVP